MVLPRPVTDELAQTAEGKGRDDLLWPGPRGADYLSLPSSDGSWLRTAMARCMKADPDFPRIGVHALRHTAASLSISAGANVKAVQAMLGHATAAMTLDVYADLFDTDVEAVADKLENVFKVCSQDAQ